ncbi:MAG: hypothetical protein RJA22_2857 [Verrucomicrobiota bacterium]
MNATWLALSALALALTPMPTPADGCPSPPPREQAAPRIDSSVAKAAAGPRGGRLLTQTVPRAELLIEKDRTVSVAFYDAEGKRLAPAGQAVAVIAEAPPGPARLELSRKGDLLVSPTPLPEGDGYQMVVQLAPAAGAKPRNFRFRLDLSHCSGCRLAEYACYCGH